MSKTVNKIITAICFILCGIIICIGCSQFTLSTLVAIFGLIILVLGCTLLKYSIKEYLRKTHKEKIGEQ